VLSLLCSSACFAQAVALPEFRGFLVDMSRLSPAQRQALTPSYIEQIKVIESVGLPAELLSFMKTIPIFADPEFSRPGTHALYRRKDITPKPKGQVVTDLTPMESKRPILLHEMLHAYDANKWDFDHATVIAAYERALSEKLYPPSAVKSHFLSNPREYFAISATIYLVGQIQQEPFNCAVLAKKQPRYVEFLEQLFGKHSHCG
jgi:hypothetical protein